MEAARYDGGTPDNTRRDLEERLDEGSIDALVAMRCLDQGIDIPEARTALFVASTTNPRQYVQRRGRVLRRPKRPTSTKDSADLYDFIVVPPELDDQRFEMNIPLKKSDWPNFNVHRQQRQRQDLAHCGDDSPVL